MTFDVDVCVLSQDFYKAYPHSTYPELMEKHGRPYTCLLIDTHDSYLVCIPFRTSIKHNEAFLFSNTLRSTISRSGLDYKKVVLVQNNLYIDSSINYKIDDDEYTMMMKNIHKIVVGIDNYISTYVDHITEKCILHSKEYTRKYKYSTLPYFHNILGLPCHDN